MPLTYDDAYQGLNTLITSYRASMADETVQLMTSVFNKHTMTKAGKGGLLPSTATKPDLTTALKLIADINWRNTYVLQNFGPSKDSDPAQVRGFCADDLYDKDAMGKRRIFVNADLATVGTVVHEFLHFCTSIEFSEASQSHKLLYEGPTEYFTRLAQPAIDRTANYPAEHHTIHKLVSDGAIPVQTLLDAYFKGSATAIKDVIAQITMSGQKIYSAIFKTLLEQTGQKL